MMINELKCYNLRREIIPPFFIVKSLSDVRLKVFRYVPDVENEVFRRPPPGFAVLPLTKGESCFGSILLLNGLWIAVHSVEFDTTHQYPVIRNYRFCVSKAL